MPHTILHGRSHDLGGGLVVRRVLPAKARQGVGPFLFFDHFGPLEVAPGVNHDVRPHPHIGLATVTYLFEGAMLHRDSLGNVQRIEPGAINWMTAGRGIVHSERKPEDVRVRAHRMHGLQLWAALPVADEETAPGFDHYPAANLPAFERPGITGRVLIGEAFGAHSPVRTFSATLYLDVQASAGASLAIDPIVQERAIYPVAGTVRVDGEPIEPGTMAVLAPDSIVQVEALEPARYVVIGGAPIDARRHLVWNFVSSRAERIEQAREDWREQRMGTVPGETEWIPLP